MPKICKKCNKEFPTKIKIDGQIKNLQNRKYCLECSPWGKHNTKKIETPIENRKERKCPKCLTTKPIEEFYPRRNIKGNSVYCKICTNKQTVERQRVFKRKCVDYKGGKCEVCGYKKCISALEFHHIDPSKKDFSISNKKLTTLNDEILQELDKCLLVCANCHREIHEDLMINNN